MRHVVPPRVADIVAAAGLSNDAFYRHFPSKDALVAALLEDGTERLQSYLAHQMAKEATPEGKVRRWVEGVLAQAADEDIAATTLAVLWNGGSVGRACRRAARRPAGRWRSCCASRSPTWAAPTPTSTPRSPPTRWSATLSDWLWERARPSAAAIDHVADVCLAMATAGRTAGHDLPPVPAPDADAGRRHRRPGARGRGRRLRGHRAHGPPRPADGGPARHVGGDDDGDLAAGADAVAGRGPPRAVRPAAAPGGARPPGGHPRPRLGRALRAGHRVGLGARRARHLRGRVGAARERGAPGESLDVMRALWTGEPVTYDGRFFRLRDAQQRPAPTRRIPIVVGGVGERTLEVVRAHADWWNVPIQSLDRLDERRDRVGDARVSAQVMVALVPTEADRAAVTELVARRFGGSIMGDATVVGTTDELVEHFGALRAAGVERFYVWFTDFAPPETLAHFGEVIAAARALGRRRGNGFRQPEDEDRVPDTGTHCLDLLATELIASGTHTFRVMPPSTRMMAPVV